MSSLKVDGVAWWPSCSWVLPHSKTELGLILWKDLFVCLPHSVCWGRCAEMTGLLTNVLFFLLCVQSVYTGPQIELFHHWLIWLFVFFSINSLIVLIMIRHEIVKNSPKQCLQVTFSVKLTVQNTKMSNLQCFNAMKSSNCSHLRS